MKLNKIMSVLLICLVIISLFLPFQEYESMWADFDPSGSLVNSNFILDDSFNQNKTIAGYELIIPIIPTILLTVGSLFYGFINKKSSKIVSLVLISLSVLFILYLYRPLGSPVKADPFSLSRPPAPIIGVGYYILLTAALVSLAFSLLRFRNKSK